MIQSVEVGSYIGEYRRTLIGMIENVDVLPIEKLVEWLSDARERGATVFVIGNGGSASTASHFACDLVKGASFGRQKRFKVIALGDSLPTLTAYANDVGYQSVFVEPLKNFAKTGDLVIAISGSGNSPNVLQAVEYAKQAGCRTVGMTGFAGGRLGQLVDLGICVGGDHMGRIEDLHLVIGHMVAYRFMESERRDPS